MDRLWRCGHCVAVFLILGLAAIMHVQASDSTTYVTETTAPNHAGVRRFYSTFSKHGVGVLKSAKSFSLKAFNLSKPKHVAVLTLFLDDMDGVAYTTSGQSKNHSEIHLSANYVGNYSGDVKYEITGVLFHESAHVWQNSLKNYGVDPYATGVIEGVADYIRLRAKYPASTWRREAGGSWYSGYSTTAYFLDWIEKNVYTGFVNVLNKKCASGDWRNSFFKEITGEDVDTLWKNYQNSFLSTT